MPVAASGNLFTLRLRIGVFPVNKVYFCPHNYTGMKVVIIEDEQLLADELEELLREVDLGIEVVAKLDSIATSVEWLRANTCDLIFLDIHLNDGLSFSIFDQVSITIPVVFTTAFDSYSIKAFELNSISYLLKPIEIEPLSRAITKYRSLQPVLSPISQLMEYLHLGDSQGKSYKKRFILAMGVVQKPVEAGDIAFFMADNKHLFAFTRDGKKYFYDSTLAKLAEELNPKQFFRINRKYYVNINSVRELLPYSKSRIKVRLTPETEDDVIISYARANDFKLWLSE